MCGLYLACFFPKIALEMPGPGKRCRTGAAAKREGICSGDRGCETDNLLAKYGSSFEGLVITFGGICSSAVKCDSSVYVMRDA